MMDRGLDKPPIYENCRAAAIFCYILRNAQQGRAAACTKRYNFVYAKALYLTGKRYKIYAE